MDSHEKRRVVEQFYAAMNTNDFRAAGDWLHAEYVLEWPQSGERVRGRDNFIAINQNYPAAGPWRFTIQHLMADESGVPALTLVGPGYSADTKAFPAAVGAVYGPHRAHVHEFAPQVVILHPKILHRDFLLLK